mgnify:CR=1 FL=1
MTEHNSEINIAYLLITDVMKETSYVMYAGKNAAVVLKNAFTVENVGECYTVLPGMVFTIEPMINAGYPDVYVDDDNGWTIYTEDDSYSAQWEIMVHVTEDGYEVMTY